MSRGPQVLPSAFTCLVVTGLLVACAPVEPPEAREVGFLCADGETLVATFPAGGESVVLDIEGERVELSRVYSGTGAQYSDGSTTTFFTTASGAVLERGGKTYADCVRSEAPSRPWIRFSPKNSASTWRWPGHEGYRPTLWEWSDLRRAWR